MRFKVVYKQLKKKFAPKGMAGKTLFFLQYRNPLSCWRYVSFDKDTNGKPLFIVFHRYMDALRECKRLEKVNAVRWFGKPKLG